MSASTKKKWRCLRNLKRKTVTNDLTFLSRLDLTANESRVIPIKIHHLETNRKVSRLKTKSWVPCRWSSPTSGKMNNQRLSPKRKSKRVGLSQILVAINLWKSPRPISIKWVKVQGQVCLALNLIGPGKNWKGRSKKRKKASKVENFSLSMRRCRQPKP